MEQRFLPGMSPGLFRVAEAARRDPGRLLSLAHHIDVDALRRAYNRIRKKAAVGIDGITKDMYGGDLEANLRELHQRLKLMRYQHQPILRVFIDKEGGKKRPIGISTTEDKIVQDVLRELLEVIYEQDFLDCSYGFRPGRKAHDALRVLNGAIYRGEARWILEADIVSFFDRLDRKHLKELLQKRIADKSLMRLIGKCLHVGVLDGGVVEVPEEGTVQGSTLSPLLANVYLHYVLDVWFEQEVRPRLRGKAILIGYCDDFVIGFERLDDAERVNDVLGKRLGQYGLELHPDKSRLLDFRRPPPKQLGKGPGTFDLLGFTFLWKRSRRGRWYVETKTRVSSLRRAKTALNRWCRRHRHWTVKEQHTALVRRIQGHFNYFGVQGNTRSLNLLVFAVGGIWFKWLNRRSQRSTLTWQRFNDMLSEYPLPKPKARISLWEKAT
jgi:group II intron reverse transcriptase/maturase